MKNEINEDAINLSQKSVLTRFGMAAASVIVITAVMALGTSAMANHKDNGNGKDNVSQTGQGTGVVNGQGSGAANGTGNLTPAPTPVPQETCTDITF